MRFNSKHLCQGTLGVDAFAFDSTGEFNWLVTPVYLIGKTIKLQTVFAHQKQAAKRF